MAIFTAPDTWNGGYCELALELGPVSDEALKAALEAIWSFPGMEGCYKDRDVEPQAQEQFAPTLDLDVWLGVATLPDSVRRACSSHSLRYEDDDTVWLSFCVPVGALGNAYPEVGSYPFGTSGLEARRPMEWEKNLEDFMLSVAHAIYDAVPFQLGLIGFEVGGETSRAEIDKNGMPAVRWWGYLVPKDEKLDWYAPTRYGAQIT